MYKGLNLNVLEDKKMNISDKGIRFIKNFEGFSPTWYKDSKGVWTIGFGHAGSLSERYNIQRINEQTAIKILQNDLSQAEDIINRLVKIDLTQNQFDALTSFVFNVGSGNFSNSTLLKRLNEGKFEEVINEFLRWNKITYKGKKVELKGLTKRREKESKLFLTGEY